MRPALLMHRDRLKSTPATRESTVHRSPIVPRSPCAEIKKSVVLAKVTWTEASRDVELITCEEPGLPEAVLSCQPQLQSLVELVDPANLEHPVRRLICKRCPHCRARTLANCKSLKSCWRTLSMRARSCHRHTLGSAKPSKMAERIRQTINSTKVNPWKAGWGSG